MPHWYNSRQLKLEREKSHRIRWESSGLVHIATISSWCGIFNMRNCADYTSLFAFIQRMKNAVLQTFSFLLCMRWDQNEIRYVIIFRVLFSTSNIPEIFWLGCLNPSYGWLFSTMQMQVFNLAVFVSFLHDESFFSLT